MTEEFIYMIVGEVTTPEKIEHKTLKYDENTGRPIEKLTYTYEHFLDDKQIKSEDDTEEFKLFFPDDNTSSDSPIYGVLIDKYSYDYDDHEEFHIKEIQRAIEEYQFKTGRNPKLYLMKFEEDNGF